MDLATHQPSDDTPYHVPHEVPGTLTT